MGFVMPHVLVLAGAGCAGLALILDIVGVATPEWFKISVSVFGSEISRSQGLWQGCQNGECGDLVSDNLPSWFEACRAFGILSILALAACLACVVLMCLMSEQKIFGLLAPVSAAVGAFCCLITFAVYAGESGQSDFGYSFALVIVAFLLAGVAAVLLFLGKSRSSG